MNKVEVATRIRSILHGLPNLAGAACKSSDPELFFPGPGRGNSKQIETAKSICGQCTERRACLEWALRDTQLSGIWGGMTDEERRGLRRSARGQQ